MDTMWKSECPLFAVFVTEENTENHWIHTTQHRMIQFHVKWAHCNTNRCCLHADRIPTDSMWNNFLWPDTPIRQKRVVAIWAMCVMCIDDTHIKPSADSYTGESAIGMATMRFVMEKPAKEPH